MKPTPIATVLLLLASSAAIPQDGTRPKFLAADIRTAPHSLQRFMRGGELHGSRYEIRNASMVDLISAAYGVDSDLVLGGPSWLEMARFDIFAEAPQRSSPAALNQMLQSLLADRFHLVAKQESKPMPAYALTAGPQPKLKPADGSEPGDCKREIRLPEMSGNPGDGVPVTITSLTWVLHCKNISIASFTDQLPLPNRVGQARRPLVDQTGLKGVWNFDFEYTMRNGGDSAAPLTEALEKQLGLKLAAVDLPTPVVTVESANETPAPSSAEDLKAFPPLPTEFDVAEIKPAAAADNNGQMTMLSARGVVMLAGRGGRGGGTPMIQNGRVTLRGATLQTLIMMAWNLPTADRLAGAPKWLNSDLFDVIAKVPAEATDAFTDIDSIRPLLRNLLTERFQMKVHTEEQQLNGYVLTAVKPKMKPADPKGRTRWINGVPEGEKDPRPGNPPTGRIVTCVNMSMAQFASLLPGIAGGYFQGADVVDRTGLAGQWDFTIYFSVAGAVGMGGRGVTVMSEARMAAGGTADASASDPSGGLSLFDAVTKLLGLKIETQKRPVSVLAIDHVEQKPVEN